MLHMESGFLEAHRPPTLMRRHPAAQRRTCMHIYGALCATFYQVMVIILTSDHAGKVVNMETEAGKSFSYEQIKKTVEEHKPAVLFLCQVRPTASQTRVCSARLNSFSGQ